MHFYFRCNISTVHHYRKSFVKAAIETVIKFELAKSLAVSKPTHCLVVAAVPFAMCSCNVCVYIYIQNNKVTRQCIKGLAQSQ